MVIIQINATAMIGSTGKIMCELDDVIRQTGNVGYTACAYTTDYLLPNQYCTNKGNYQFPLKKNILFSRITGCTGYRYKHSTKQLVEWIASKRPDVIHLHNIHGDWLHLKTLFDYLSKNNIPVVWTLHDCWPFTGRCSHFELCSCQKWKTKCFRCKNRRVYPITYMFDFSKMMYRHKRKMFTSIEKMIIVTPSQWLKNYVEESYLKKYPVRVIHNGIDTTRYCETKDESDKGFNQESKKILLGVASSWSETKGFTDLLEINKRIDHNQYRIVMIGLSERQMKMMPETILGIKRTNSQEELIKWYSRAYAFLNLTYQDNFPTTNLEALACGTPVITYKTGGSPESIDPQTGFVVEKGDVDGVLKKIMEIGTIDRSNCSSSARKLFEKRDRYNEYIKIYEEVLNE